MEDKFIARLMRIDGQINGIVRMYDEGRPCEDILQQISAVRSALDKLTVILMRQGACQNLSPAQREKISNIIDKVLKMR